MIIIGHIFSSMNVQKAIGYSVWNSERGSVLKMEVETIGV